MPIRTGLLSPRQLRSLDQATCSTQRERCDCPRCSHDRSFLADSVSRSVEVPWGTCLQFTPGELAQIFLGLLEQLFHLVPAFRIGDVLLC